MVLVMFQTDEERSEDGGHEPGKFSHHAQGALDEGVVRELRIHQEENPKQNIPQQGNHHPLPLQEPLRGEQRRFLEPHIDDKRGNGRSNHQDEQQH